MVSWEFPVSLQHIWGQLIPSKRFEIVERCLENQEFRRRRRIFRRLAEDRHSREQTIVRWPASKLANPLVRLCDAGSIDLGDVFRAYHFETQAAMMSAFLDQLRIPQENGYLREAPNPAPTASDLEIAIAFLLKRFPAESIALYTQVLAAMNESMWSELRNVDFPRIDSLSEPTKPENNQASVTSELRSCSTLSEVSDFPIEEDRPLQEWKDMQYKSSVDLISEIDSLNTDFSALRDELSHADAKLKNGILPQAELPERINALVKKFSSVAQRATKRADAAGLNRAFGSDTSIKEIRALIAEVEHREHLLEEERNGKRQALHVFDTVLGLRRLDSRDFVPLLEQTDH